MMNDDKVDPIDALLREEFAGPIPDDGFCNHVMDRLPARRHRRNWPLAAGAMTGLAMCWISLWYAPLSAIGWRDWFAGDPSTSTAALFAALFGMVILQVIWLITEVEDQVDPSWQSGCHLHLHPQTR